MTEFEKQCLVVLRAGLKAMDITIASAIQQKLIQYLQLLNQWNAVYNLSAVRDPLGMVQRHLLDSLSILPYVPEGRILDVGTGAGLPGIPLALCCPKSQFVLLDSRQKKITFVRHVLISLELVTAEALCMRVEDYKPESLFDLVMCRAFSSLSTFISQSRHLSEDDGFLLAMKTDPDFIKAEILPAGAQITAIHALQVPGLRDRCAALVRVTSGAYQ